ncbi:MAG: superoxide dismutase [Pigeon pea little leaf phytoplasma]|uniref:Superoxide dismutase n=1 Tax=Candidatus Phytoplasma fabacearum TaxID=2982628 RepID=A0ABU8ZS27_9MOLU|nr:superoxide dismutase ['Bituminaria bituminosa' little leaf phytoplasma]MDV3148967.1 superoxide dismutase [Pigeon pea little leaf phytoplasma]MDO7983466.1 superoxide dismutase ['Bituminaria bituminosa' little leaf phytoplasma]MDO8023783.1 superoxide dismutase ['Bituminaria bituminosa' little leaf phytoplasma]MDO8030398.1 superoxide dismutase ['Bituminaria bituminosa' little leaf phytoplasma]MDV3153996.1 superoxide dismutase [Pigeon pea little leaf phytoplasma]
MKYQLPTLNYKYNELEPFITTKTMMIHHQKHHQTYIDKLNISLSQFPNIQDNINNLLTNLSSIPQEIRKSVHNNGGGHFNHSFFWKILKPKITNETILLNETQKIIKRDYKNLDNFKNQFTNKALNLFGSGWVWWIINNNNLSEIITTSNQDTTHNLGHPILGLDLWEHAYYLDFQNRRQDYIEAFFHIINWEQVEINLNNSFLNKE